MGVLCSWRHADGGGREGPERTLYRAARPPLARRYPAGQQTLQMPEYADYCALDNWFDFEGAIRKERHTLSLSGSQPADRRSSSRPGRSRRQTTTWITTRLLGSAKPRALSLWAAAAARSEAAAGPGARFAVCGESRARSASASHSTSLHWTSVSEYILYGYTILPLISIRISTRGCSKVLTYVMIKENV